MDLYALFIFSHWHLLSHHLSLGKGIESMVGHTDRHQLVTTPDAELASTTLAPCRISA